jgi:osmoprotectant transport system permease protein
MYSLLLKGYTDFNVETKTGLGGTKICFDALVNNQIDLYPEYTGTGLLVILNPKKDVVDKMIGSKEQVFSFVKSEFSKRYSLDWLQPIGFNNAYALMMRRKQAEEAHISTISDLALAVEK